jgi:aspartate racemase
MPAASDQEHLPTVVWNVPQIPDRQEALAGTGTSPLPAMCAGIDRLVAAGATRIAIPCNTAHLWFDELAAFSAVPIVHVVAATLQELGGASPGKTTLGLIATRAMQASNLYQRRLEADGFACQCASEDELETLFTPGCYAVKRGDVEAGGRLFDALAEALLARGAQRLVLACTEVPIALSRIASRHLAISIDTNRALARACVAYWQQARR